MKKKDWEYIRYCLLDIKESTEALEKWDKKDMSEYHYHAIIIDISLENIKTEMGMR